MRFQVFFTTTTTHVLTIEAADAAEAETSARTLVDANGLKSYWGTTDTDIAVIPVEEDDALAARA